MHSQGTNNPICVDFTGIWISDAFEEIMLEQRGSEVTGTYTRRGGGTIGGDVQENLLHFTWQDSAVTTNKEGWGFVRVLADGRTLAGLWGYGQDKSRSESILAGLVKRSNQFPIENQPVRNKMDMKYAAYDLVLHRKYEQALPMLKKALELYRAELQNESITDAYLIDEINIQARLLRCYFELADYRGMPEILGVVKQQESFYEELLEYLQSSMDSYQTFLRRTFQGRTTNPIKELTKAAESLKGWQEQCVVQAAILKEKEAGDSRSARLLALANQLEQSYTTIIVARDDIAALAQQSFGKQDALIRALTLLASHLERVRQQITSDIEAMKVLGADWPPEQQEIIQWITDFLLLIPLHMEGESRLITQASNNIEERVNFTWESAFDLSRWLERWRVRLLTDAAKIEALEKGQPFFQKLIQFFVDLDNGTEALVLSERARARAFVDLLAARAIVQEDTRRVVSRQRNASPTTREDILEIVQKRNSLTIEYFFTETKLIIWVITPAGNITSCISPASRNDIEQLISEFSQLVQIMDYSPQKATHLSEVLQKLYACLIAPVLNQLAALTQEEVITIIPHGQLFLVPFSALKNEQGEYLIEKHALVYSPAIDVLKYTRKNIDRVVHRDRPNLLAFVNPQSGLGSLEFTEQEFERITRFYADPQRNKVCMGKYALKQVLEQEAPKYTVLCFATHAQAFDENPLDSYLALAATPSENGYLRIPAIFQLELHTDLVILSACETGRGKITGDGVNGLNRAFISAGTPSLMMSLWSIPEEESLNQLYIFHEFWRKVGTSKAQALRRAQLEGLANHSEEPDIWAGFSLVGEWT